MSTVISPVTGVIFASKRLNRIAINPTHGQTGWKLEEEVWQHLIYYKPRNEWLLLEDYREVVRQQKECNRQQFALRPYDERRRIIRPVFKGDRYMHL